MSELMKTVLRVISTMDVEITLSLRGGGTSLEWDVAVRDKLYRGTTLVADIEHHIRELIMMYSVHPRVKLTNSDDDLLN